MPIEHVWGLVLVLAGVAVLAVLDDVRVRATREKTNEELSSIRENFKVNEKEYKENISCLKELHQKETEKFRNEIASLSHKEIPHEVIKNLPTEQIKILEILFKQGKLSFSEISEFLKFSKQEAKYHLEELQSIGMVSVNTFRPEIHPPSHIQTNKKYYRDYTISDWSIEQEGRKYLIDNGIV